MKRALTAAIAAGWLAVGLYGAWAYGHDYQVYRGFSPPRDPQGIAPGRVVVRHFYSRALKRWDRYAVYEPPGYRAMVRAGRRFPVLYLLHGDHSGYIVWIRAGAVNVQADILYAKHRLRPFLIVMPWGDDGTFVTDTEWADTRDGRYGSYLLDVVHDADAHFPTIPDRSGRALAGMSMGGYGAINVLFRHLAIFGAGEAWSGYFEQTRTGPYAHAGPAVLRYASPTAYVPALRSALRRWPVRVLLDGGRSDPDTRQIAPLARELRALGTPVRALTFAGRHDWKFWRGHLGLGLRWASWALH